MFSVNKAIILAAGFGSRMIPVTLDTPKPLVKVNGTRIIDTLLDALLAAGINDITVVRGYKKEQFDILHEKYPKIKFRDNDFYASTNSISSLYSALDELDVEDGCYICEADLIVKNPQVIAKLHSSSDFLAMPVERTDDWSLQEKDGWAVNYVKGNVKCFNVFGIAYWSPGDCSKMKKDVKDLWDKNDRNIFYEYVPLVRFRDNYKVKIRRCVNGDILEIDNFSELVAIDSSYINYSPQKQNVQE